MLGRLVFRREDLRNHRRNGPLHEISSRTACRSLAEALVQIMAISGDLLASTVSRIVHLASFIAAD